MRERHGATWMIVGSAPSSADWSRDPGGIKDE